MKNRILAFLMAFALLLALLSVSAAAADTELRIIGPTEAPAVGEEFTVTVELKGNPGIVGVRLALAYDKEKLSCTDIEFGRATIGMMTASNPDARDGAMIAAADVEPSTRDGVIAVFTFEVLQANAEMPRELKTVELSLLGGDKLQYSLVQLNEDGTETGSPSDDSGTGTGDETGSGTGSTDTGTGNSDTGSGTPSGGDTGSGESGGGETGTTGGETEQPDTPTETAVTFPDVPADKWYADYVGKAAAKGWFTGFEDGTFRPAGQVTRGQFVTVLWRMAGKPAPTQAGVFTDVPAGAWYAEAVDWAYEKGYVNGRTTEPMTFDPGGSITRQEAMKILFLYNGGVSGMEAMLTGIYDGDFADSGSIASWAKPAMYWGYYNGILNGKTTSTLAPVDTATRAELAKILVVYDEKML